MVLYKVFSYLTAINDKIAQEYDLNTNQGRKVENKIYLMVSFSYNVPRICGIFTKKIKATNF